MHVLIYLIWIDDKSQHTSQSEMISKQVKFVNGTIIQLSNPVFTELMLYSMHTSDDDWFGIRLAISDNQLFNFTEYNEKSMSGDVLQCNNTGLSDLYMTVICENIIHHTTQNSTADIHQFIQTNAIQLT